VLQKKFIVNIIIIVLVNLAIKPIWIFGVDRNVQLALGDAQYGLYAALLNLSIVFNIILDIGLTNYNTKVIAEDVHAIQHQLVNIAVVKLVLFILYIFLLLVCGVVFGYTSSSLYLLFLLGVLQFLNSFLTFLRSNIAANQFFKTDSIISIIDKIVVLLLFGGYILLINNLQNFTISLFLYFQIFGYAVAIIVALLFTKKIVLLPITWHTDKLFATIKSSLPYAVLVLLMGVYIRSDLFLIERWLPNGAMQSGMYAKSFRLLDAFNMIGFLFAGMLLPMFAKQFSKGISITPLLTLSAKLLLPAAFIVSIFCGFYAVEIMQLLYHSNQTILVESFIIVMAVLPAMCAMNIFSTLLASAGKIKTMIGITGVATLVSVVANYIVMHSFDNYLPVCIVAIVVQYGVNAAYIYYCQKTIGKLFDQNILGKLLLTIVLFIGLNTLLRYLNLCLLTGLLVNGIACIPMLFAFGLLEFKKWKQFFSTN
jgi:O-antigen/teichoic acid export membrane protein